MSDTNDVVRHDDDLDGLGPMAFSVGLDETLPFEGAAEDTDSTGREAIAIGLTQGDGAAPASQDDVVPSLLATAGEDEAASASPNPVAMAARGAADALADASIAVNAPLGAFIEKDGIVVIEAESADNLPGAWRTRDNYNSNVTSGIDNAGNATGGDFIVWEGKQYFGAPGNGVVTYEVQISKTGVYTFEWRSQVGRGSETSEHNDTWLKIEADQFYGYQASDDTYVRPVGAPAGSFPPNSAYPSGASKDGWFKVYHGTQNWNWGGWTSDHDGHRIKAVFDAPGTYSIHLSARSSSHVIDRMVLWHDDVNGNVAKNLSRAESERVGDTTPEPPILPEPPSPAEAKVYLIDADSDTRKGEVTDGASIDLSVLDGAHFALEAVTDPDDSVASVRMTYGTHVQVESVAPYALFGDHSGDFFGRGLAAGAKTIKVELFSGTNATGTLLGTTEIDFTVTGTAPPEPPEPPVDAPPFDPDGLAGQADHIVFHFDGNNNDRDDISAIPIAALLAKAGGVEDKMTFLYGNNLSERNEDSRMPELDAGGALAEKLGIEALNYQDNIAATTARLVEIISNGDDVLLIEGGPMEAVYRAMEQVDPSFHSNLTLLSHSSWNEDRDVINLPGITQARTWADLKADFPNATYVDIRDQNDGHNNERGFNNRGWEWMDSSDEPLVQEVRDIMQFAQYALNDPSDAGMLFYAMTGIDNAEPSHAKAFMEASDLFDAPVDPPASGSVSGRLFIDGDGDGKNDNDEGDPGLAGHRVELRHDGDMVAATETNANGWYIFRDVPVDSGYSVRFYHDGADLAFAPAPGQSVGGAGNLNTAPFDVVENGKTTGIHGMFAAPPVETGRLEMGTVSVSQSGGQTWINVTFEEAIENAVVVLGPASSNGNSPVITRVNAVSDTGFSMMIDEWDYLNGWHQEETISWMAMTEGRHKLLDGTVIEAGSVDAQNEAAAAVSFGSSFDAGPLVFAQVSSDRDSTPVTSRISDVDASGFDVALQEEEAGDGLHTSEQVSWIAVENADSVLFDYEGTMALDHTWSKIHSGPSAPSDVFFADMQTMNGMDTADLRYQDVGNGKIVMVQEEASLDNETSHTTETIAYLLGQTGSFDLYA
ncbi:MAG: SdrD B-like domain-containing protein [Pseudomonadota bacterium]